jgi:death-on-curing protein
MRRVELEDYLVIAENLLGISAETLKHATKISLAESALNAPFATFDGQGFYPEPADRAAILCSRLVRNHPLPDGNKRTALLAMLMFLDLNGYRWTETDQDEIAQVIEWLAARTMAEEDFIDWVRARVHGA